MINFVYFDLGGVIVKDFTETNKWEKLKKEWGITTKQNIEFEEFWEEYEPRVCAGMHINDLIPPINKQFGTKIPLRHSLLNDFVDRFRSNKSIWPIVNKMKKICRVGLLTNMYPDMLSTIQKQGILPNVKWDVVIDSSIEGYLKPERQLFEIAQERAKIEKREILFVENSMQHIKAAREFGWQTFFYDSADYSKSSHKLSKLLQYYQQRNVFKMINSD
ncbi:MAG: HAD family hydrolase [Candidatus Micrarchaeales archaeon]|jgi:FMN phosphatase YigB (HAD superfamily)